MRVQRTVTVELADGREMHYAERVVRWNGPPLAAKFERTPHPGLQVLRDLMCGSKVDAARLPALDEYITIMEEWARDEIANFRPIADGDGEHAAMARVIVESRHECLDDFGTFFGMVVHPTQLALRLERWTV